MEQLELFILTKLKKYKLFLKKSLTIIKNYGRISTESEVINMNNVVKIGCNEYGTLENFYRITMRTKNGKKLYLTEDKWVGKKAEKLLCKWVFEKNNALWFESLENAKQFTKDYFKNFVNYEIEGFVEIL